MEDGRKLKAANENPWYILLTLYGEQEGNGFNESLAERNRKAWNAWAGQALSRDAQEKAAESSDIDVAELRAWADLQDEIKDRFKDRWEQHNTSDCPALPDPKNIINLRGTHCPNTVLLGQCVFPANADFRNATFSANAFFSSATFSATAFFNSATFSANAFFSSATFSATAFFNSATFSANAYFSSATFSATADFHSATFSANASFHSSTFAGFSYFTETHFGVEKVGSLCVADFADCQFEKPTSFRAARFRHNFPDFDGAVLHDNTSFTAETEFWPEQPKQPAERSRDSCAIIRHAIAKQGLPEDEHFFFRKEMAFAGQIGGFWDRVPYRAFGWVSDYGYSILRPSLCLLGLWLIPAMIYLIAFTWANVMADSFNVSLRAFGFSFANIFKFLGFQRVYFDFEEIRALSGWLQFLSASQTVLGFVFLFFLGLGLRQRFRLR